MLRQSVMVCHAHGISHVVLCPGSRSAPIALSFLRFDRITHYVIPDERSAAYTALGISRQLRKPVALVCTSGTAALNFAPAVAEAFFSEIPLIVFTADRPAEWIGQADNQAIFQEKIYGNQVKAFYNLPTDFSHPDSEWYAIRMMNEAMNTANAQPIGPVHINVPLREPLYLKEYPDFNGLAPKIIRMERSAKKLADTIIEKLAKYRKILVVAGTHRPNEDLKETISRCILDKNLVFFPDISSNLLNINGKISLAELTINGLSGADTEDFAPDLVISFGGPVVSKTMKNFLKSNSVREHWHLCGHTSSADTFQKLTEVFDISAAGFFKSILENKIVNFDKDYFNIWSEKDKIAKQSAIKILGTLPFSEISAAFQLLSILPEHSVLHLGNSLPVRYASIFPFIKPGIEIYSNRGTSGIDGTVSAAVGQSMVDERTHTLICGDLAFMYDRNGLWNNYLKDNLKIIVFNNHGGGIFRTLPGARDQKELEEYFTVHQPLSFEHTALQHQCQYFYCDKGEDLEDKLSEFYATKGRPAVLEIDFDGSKYLSIGEVVKTINNQ